MKPRYPYLFVGLRPAAMDVAVAPRCIPVGMRMCESSVQLDLVSGEGRKEEEEEEERKKKGGKEGRRIKRVQQQNRGTKG